MQRSIRFRGEHGELSLVGWAVVLFVVGSLVAIPYVFMTRKEVETAQTGIDAIGQANDVSAQLSLKNALVGAQTWYAEQGSLMGYGAAQATAFDPQTPYDEAGIATSGRVSVRGVGPDTIVFVTKGGAGPLCAALNAGSATYGTVDAASAAQCSGTGW
jgi:hypothetical protein